MAIQVSDAIKILNLLLDVEPIAVELVKNLLAEIKGKSAAEIIAENDAIFERVKATAAAELAKLDAAPNPNPLP